MSETASTIQVLPNTLLSIRRWQVPVASDFPPILLVHGYGEHIMRYVHVAQFLNRHGFDVWGYDARGHGVSQGKQGFLDTENILVDDCAAVFRHVADATQRTPIVIAHSMGGLTAALGVALQRFKPTALVLSSPLMRVKMSFFQKCLLNVGLLLMKNKPIHSPAVDAQYVSRDPFIVNQYQKDPLNHAMISPNFARWMRDGGARVRSRAVTFTMPTLLIYAGSDRVVDASGSDDLAAVLPAETTMVRRYDVAYHEIFNEPEVERQAILQHMVDWLLQQGRKK